MAGECANLKKRVPEKMLNFGQRLSNLIRGNALRCASALIDFHGDRRLLTQEGSRGGTTRVRFVIGPPWTSDIFWEASTWLVRNTAAECRSCCGRGDIYRRVAHIGFPRMTSSAQQCVCDRYQPLGSPLRYCLHLGVCAAQCVTDSNCSQ